MSWGIIHLTRHIYFLIVLFSPWGFSVNYFFCCFYILISFWLWSFDFIFAIRSLLSPHTFTFTSLFFLWLHLSYEILAVCVFLSSILLWFFNWRTFFSILSRAFELFRIRKVLMDDFFLYWTFNSLYFLFLWLLFLSLNTFQIFLLFILMHKFILFSLTLWLLFFDNISLALFVLNEPFSIDIL